MSFLYFFVGLFRLAVGLSVAAILLTETLFFLPPMLEPDAYGYAFGFGAPLMALGVCGITSSILFKFSAEPSGFEGPAFRRDFSIFVALVAHVIACSALLFLYFVSFPNDLNSWGKITEFLKNIWVLPLMLLSCATAAALFFITRFFAVFGCLLLISLLVFEGAWAFGFSRSVIEIFPLAEKLFANAVGFTFFFPALGAYSLAALFLSAYRFMRPSYLPS